MPSIEAQGMVKELRMEAFRGMKFRRGCSFVKPMCTYRV